MNYFVVSDDGNQHGPADLLLLQSWADQGRIVESTVIIDENGVRHSPVTFLHLPSRHPDPAPPEILTSSAPEILPDSAPGAKSSSQTSQTFPTPQKLPQKNHLGPGTVTPKPRAPSVPIQPNPPSTTPGPIIHGPINSDSFNSQTPPSSNRGSYKSGQKPPSFMSQLRSRNGRNMVDPVYGGLPEIDNPLVDLLVYIGIASLCCNTFFAIVGIVLAAKIHLSGVSFGKYLIALSFLILTTNLFVHYYYH